MLYIMISIPALAVLFLLSYFGEKKGFYGENGENLLFGKVMHFSGGFLVACFWTGFTNSYLQIIILTFLAGVLWEFWEYFYGFCRFKKDGIKRHMTKIPDTLEDLVFDIIGAAVWVLIVSNFF